MKAENYLLYCERIAIRKRHEFINVVKVVLAICVILFFGYLITTVGR